MKEEEPTSDRHGGSRQNGTDPLQTTDSAAIAFMVARSFNETVQHAF